MIHPPQVRPEEPIAVTPHDGICGGKSQQWLSYPTNLHVRVCEGRGWQHPRLLGNASGTPMPTKPEVQSASPVWMTATASAAVTILLRMTASAERLLGGPAAVHGERLAPDLLGGVRAQEDCKAAQLLRRDEL